MAKATTLKDALKAWEAKKGQKFTEATEIKLIGILPPIEKMDNSLAGIKTIKQLSLSSNNIDKIANLTGLDSLEILSLGRNLIKQLAGIEPVADTLKQLWISYNFIEKLNGIEKCKNLRVLYISNNKVEKWSEFEKLQELPLLEDLLFIGNPLHEQYSKDERVWRLEVLKRLPNLKKLDGKFVSEDEREQARGQS